MRVITGKYKGRRFDVPHTFKARPTTDFAKENLFNVLQSYVDFDDEPRAMDLFAGTGSITIELLSRGCSSVVSVELDQQHYNFIRSVLRTLGDDHCTLLRGDVQRIVSRVQGPFDLIFADPPYALPWLAQLPDMVLSRPDLLASEGIFVLEHGKDNDFSAHPHFVEHRHYGSVNFSIFSIH